MSPGGMRRSEVSRCHQHFWVSDREMADVPSTSSMVNCWLCKNYYYFFFFCCQHIGYVTLENYAIILQTVKTQQTPAGGQWWEKASAWSLLQSCWSTRLWLHKAPLLLLGFHWVIFNPPSIRHCKDVASLYAPHLGLKIVPFPRFNRVGKKMAAMPIAGGKSPDAWPSGIQQIW